MRSKTKVKNWKGVINTVSMIVKGLRSVLHKITTACRLRPIWPRLLQANTQANTGSHPGYYRLWQTNTQTTTGCYRLTPRLIKANTKATIGCYKLKGSLWFEVDATQGGYRHVTSLRRTLLASTARAWRAPPKKCNLASRRRSRKGCDWFANYIISGKTLCM